MVRIFMLYVSVHGMILYIYSLWWLFGFIALFNLMLLFIFGFLILTRYVYCVGGGWCCVPAGRGVFESIMFIN